MSAYNTEIICLCNVLCICDVDNKAKITWGKTMNGELLNSWPKDEKGEPEEPVLEGVYMGPPVTEEEAPMAAAEVKEVPDAENDPKKQMRRDKGPRMEALYAAPRRPETGRMMLVYAGPDYFANRGKMQTPMAPVYAGPDFFANRGNSQKPAAPGNAESGPSASRQDPQAQAEDGSFIVCPVCGERVPRGGRFCMTCGARLPRDEEGDRII